MVAEKGQIQEKDKSAKRVVCITKMSAKERWGRKMTENYHENKMFWKAVQRIRKKTSRHRRKG